jgi:hydrogenase maturation protease
LPDDKRILIYAYGNPGRQDDGLGNRFIEEISRWIENENLPHVELESNYQLNIEDAVTIAGRELVVFIDASIEDIEDYRLSEVIPSEGRSEFTMHSVSPAFVLALCIRLYDKHPRTYLLSIKGYEWEFREGLSDRAEMNLSRALAFLKEKLEDPASLSEPPKDNPVG